MIASVLGGATLWLWGAVELSPLHRPPVQPWLLATSAPVLRSTGEPARARLAGVHLIIGSTPRELETLAAACNRIAGAAVCRPETFALELSPGAPIRVPSFFFDVREVSVRAYDRCVSAGRCPPPTSIATGDTGTDPRDLPVVGVSQQEARAYCAFAGGRLPHEHEFERAVRGPRSRQYSWGERFHEGRLNGGSWGAALTNPADGFERLAPVGAFVDGRTPEGILQLLGNAEEWTGAEPGVPLGGTNEGSGDQNSGTSSGLGVVRGGHFADPPWNLRGPARRIVPCQSRRPTLGFRCAKSDPRPPPRRTP